MNQSEIIIRIFLTIIFGFILGLETETREIEKRGQTIAQKEEKQRIGGVRTYTVISLIGGITGLLYTEKAYVLTYMIFGGILAFILSAYILNVQLKKAFGLTTEIAVIITFLLGFLTTSQVLELDIVLIILVLLAFFLSQKRGVGELVHKIKHEEFIDFVKFGLISLVVLPLLPNENFKVVDLVNALELPLDNFSKDFLNFALINPFSIWLIVVLVSGFSLLGYALAKFLGKKKSTIFTSILGGMVSSTSTVVALASRSKKDSSVQDTNMYAGSAILANAISFIPIGSLIFVINFDLFKHLFPTLAVMLVTGLITGLFVIYILPGSKVQISHVNIKQKPFAIGPAIEFVALIVIIKLFVQAVQLIDSNSLFLASTSISGLVGLDPPVVAVGELSRINLITLQLASYAIIGANSVNLIAKCIYSYILGNKNFALKTSIGLIITLTVSIITVFLTI